MAGFAVEMKNFFGLLPGTTIKDFAAELRELSISEKKEFAEMLRGQGIQCDEPAGIQ
jgi:hypothetical protein